MSFCVQVNNLLECQTCQNTISTTNWPTFYVINHTVNTKTSQNKYELFYAFEDFYTQKIRDTIEKCFTQFL